MKNLMVIYIYYLFNLHTEKFVDVSACERLYFPLKSISNITLLPVEESVELMYVFWMLESWVLLTPSGYWDDGGDDSGHACCRPLPWCLYRQPSPHVTRSLVPRGSCVMSSASAREAVDAWSYRGVQRHRVVTVDFTVQ